MDAFEKQALKNELTAFVQEVFHSYQKAVSETLAAIEARTQERVDGILAYATRGIEEAAKKFELDLKEIVAENAEPKKSLFRRVFGG